MVTGMRVGELAAKAGVSAPTVRFYERAGLLAPPLRSDARYRLYGAEALRDLRFVARAKALGLSLDQIRTLRSQPDARAERRELRHLIAHQLVRTRRQRAELEALEDNLTSLFQTLQLNSPGCSCAPDESTLVDEITRIEAAACTCGCALDPGCTCGCPCCALDEGGMA